MVATLVAARGEEPHFLWWVDEKQWDALDKCEGTHYGVYELQVVAGTVRHRDGMVVPGVRAYVGLAASRQPRRDADGHPLLVRDLSPEIVQSPDFV